jgi:hypothetical protein
MYVDPLKRPDDLASSGRPGLIVLLPAHAQRSMDYGDVVSIQILLQCTPALPCLRGTLGGATSNANTAALCIAIGDVDGLLNGAEIVIVVI